MSKGEGGGRSLDDDGCGGGGGGNAQCGEMTSIGETTAVGIAVGSKAVEFRRDVKVLKYMMFM